MTRTYLMLSVYVGYKISEPEVFFRKWPNGSIAEAEKALEALVRSSKNEVAGRHNFPGFHFRRPTTGEFRPDRAGNPAGGATAAGGSAPGGQFLRGGDQVHPDQEDRPAGSVTETVFDRMTSERQFYISQIQSEGELQGHADQIRGRQTGHHAAL